MAKILLLFMKNCSKKYLNLYCFSISCKATTNWIMASRPLSTCLSSHCKFLFIALIETSLILMTNMVYSMCTQVASEFMILMAHLVLAHTTYT